MRGGKPVASICPVGAPVKERHLGELKELVKGIPRLGDEVEKFEKDLKDVLRNQPAVPKENKWA
jgi:antitoxin (DNA-binding transcriptional repressor) of toxin-antitoxin stability system